MDVSRRSFLTAAAALAFAPVLTGCEPTEAPSRLLSAYADKSGEFGTLLWQDGQLTQWGTQQVRFHRLVAAPQKPLLLGIARRPGTLGLLANWQTGEVQKFQAAPDHHFYGHADFAATGDVFFTSENAYEQEEGRIGVRRAESGQLLASWSAHGIGPHEIIHRRRHPQLAIAIGGMLTHPHMSRAVLNLDTMRPALVLLNSATGQKEHDARLPDEYQHLSIRHLTEANGQVYFACQDQITRAEPAPLAGYLNENGTLEFLSADRSVWASCKGYIGSIATDETEKWIGVTSPKGGMAHFWNRFTHEYAGLIPAEDVCGITAGRVDGTFTLSTGEGMLMEVSLASGQPIITHQQATAIRWDNHLTRVTAS